MQVAELHRRLAEHRKTLHGALDNRLLSHGTEIACEQLDYVAWQKNFPRGVRDRAPGLLVEMMRRCQCGISEDRDLFSAYLGLHVRTQVGGVDRLDLQSAREG